jgi:hypothetical protein
MLWIKSDLAKLHSEIEEHAQGLSRINFKINFSYSCYTEIE